MRIFYLGNFVPEFSTENEILTALAVHGHEVVSVQEGDDTAMRLAAKQLDVERPSFLLWTRTASLARKAPQAQHVLLRTARRCGVPVIGYHLDRWWGLRRQREIRSDPFFRVDLLVTADGGHDDQWAAAGVNHVWFPPAVSARWCVIGEPRDEYMSRVAFVGNWQDYHPEWTHRRQLVEFLRDRFGDDVRFWPEPGRPAIRGFDLCDLYASVDVVVGDSCLVPRVDGSPMVRYCSDRVPETLGRGGVLVHPHVDGISDRFPHVSWPLGDWDALGHVIDDTLNSVVDRQFLVDRIVAQHTYEVRVRELVTVLKDRGLLV